MQWEAGCKCQGLHEIQQNVRSVSAGFRHRSPPTTCNPWSIPVMTCSKRGRRNAEKKRDESTGTWLPSLFLLSKHIPYGSSRTFLRNGTGVLFWGVKRLNTFSGGVWIHWDLLSGIWDMVKDSLSGEPTKAHDTIPKSLKRNFREVLWSFLCHRKYWHNTVDGAANSCTKRMVKTLKVMG